MQMSEIKSAIDQVVVELFPSYEINGLADAVSDGETDTVVNPVSFEEDEAAEMLALVDPLEAPLEAPELDSLESPELDPSESLESGLPEVVAVVTAEVNEADFVLFSAASFVQLAQSVVSVTVVMLLSVTVLVSLSVLLFPSPFTVSLD